MAEDSGRSNPIKGVVEGVKGVAKQAVGAVAGQKYLMREGKAQAAQASGYIPGAPSSEAPDKDEPTTPREPLPPKPDQVAPELRTATGTPLEGPETARGQQDQYLTTAQGARLYDTDHSLKAGARGPTLLQDHHLREKITHFDHERIPERVVHARGAARPRGVPRVWAAAKIIAAGFLGRRGDAGVRPVLHRAGFARLGGHGARHPRVRHQVLHRARARSTWSATTSRCSSSRTASSSPTSSTPASRTRTARSRRPRSAHDTFWDFVSLHTEATAHTMWNMSDRGIPRSYRMMEGFGVHTFRLVTPDGATSLVKFHWKPRAGRALAGVGGGADRRRRRSRLPPPRPRRRHRGRRLPRVGAGRPGVPRDCRADLRGHRPARPDQDRARGAGPVAVDRHA